MTSTQSTGSKASIVFDRKRLMVAHVKKRFTEEKMVKILGDQQEGKRVNVIARDHDISESTFYNWMRKYDELTVAEVHKLRALEDENSRLKRLVADLALDIQAQKGIIKSPASLSEKECVQPHPKSLRVISATLLRAGSDCSLRRSV